MVIEAKESVLGIPRRRETLGVNTVEPLKVDEGDIAEDYINDVVWRDAVVDSPDRVRVRERDSRGWITSETVLEGPAINKANLGRRRIIFFRRSLHWRPDSTTA